MSDYHIDALKGALKRLSESPFLPAAVRYLANNAAAISAELGKTVLAEIPALSASATTCLRHHGFRQRIEKHHSRSNSPTSRIA